MLMIARVAAGHAVPRSVLPVCVALGLLAGSAAAQELSTSREELIRKWDLDRDGKISDGEAEVARSRMRRARSNAELGGGTDPLTGRPRAGGESATGAAPAVRPEAGQSPAIRLEAQSSTIRPEDDGGLILVPGTGDRGGRPLGLPPEPAALPRRDRAALPGNRAPAPVSPVPQAATRNSQPGPPSAPTQARSGSGLLPGREDRTAGRDERSAGAGRELTSRARVLPGGPPAIEGVRQPPVPARPGVIAGGAGPGGPRGSLPAVRPGYGAGGPNDLNAGRLPAGLPSSRGTAAGPAAANRQGPEGQAPPGRRPPSGLPGPRAAMSAPPTLPPPPRPGGAAAAPRSTSAPRVPRPAAENVYGR